MFHCVRAALRRIQEDLAHVLDANQITDVCREVGYSFRKRLLDPIATIQLFVVQILNGNFAVGRLKDFTAEEFSEAAYCKARGRLPLCVFETLLQRVGAALRTTLRGKGDSVGTVALTGLIFLEGTDARERDCPLFQQRRPK